jgi:hypothetical protein
MGKMVVVAGVGFKSMGYRDASGTWRHYRTSQKLPKVVAWEELFEPPIMQFGNAKSPASTEDCDARDNPASISVPSGRI